MNFSHLILSKTPFIQKPTLLIYMINVFWGGHKARWE